MNIFKALTYGKGKYKEVHITGLVAYLLNPIEEHGLGNIFLKEFLTETCKLDDGNPDDETINRLLSDEHYVEVLPEEPVRLPEGGVVYPDILINIKEKDHQNLAAKFILELKINKNSEGDSQQLVDQLRGVRHEIYEEDDNIYEEDDNTTNEIKIYHTYLIPQALTGKRPFRSLEEHIRIENEKQDFHKLHCNEITWNRFQDFIKNIINKDSDAEIYPLSPFVLYVLKSFKLWLNEEVILTTTRRRRNNNNIAGFLTWRYWVDIFINPRTGHQTLHEPEDLDELALHDDNYYYRCLLVFGTGPNGGSPKARLLQYSQQNFEENNQLAIDQLYTLDTQLPDQIKQENLHSSPEELMSLSINNDEEDGDKVFNEDLTVKNNIIYFVNNNLSPEEKGELVSLSVAATDPNRHYINRWTLQGEWNYGDNVRTHTGDLTKVLFSDFYQIPAFDVDN